MLFQQLGRRCQERRVAPELVQHEATDPPTVGLRKQAPRPVEVREHAAAVDVPDEDDRRVGDPRRAHVGEVGLEEVDLRRAARPLEQHEVVLGQKLAQRALDRRPEPGAALAPGQCAEREVARPSTTTWLRVSAFGLDEHRVHAHVGRDPRGERLEVLRDADLAAVDDPRVVRHVLGLERRDPTPRRANQRASAVTSRLLPAELDTPCTISALIAAPARTAGAPSPCTMRTVAP